MEELKITPDEKVCYNCKHTAWMIGIGQGLKCSNPKKEIKNETIPSMRHTCELFEQKESLKPLGEEL